MRTPSFLAALVLCGAISSPPTQARAADLDEGGALYAVQNRRYTQSHEFAFTGGVLPMDAFYKGYTAGASYTLHFNDLWAWEIVNGAWSFNLDTSLREDLQTSWQVEPTQFPSIQWLGNSNLMFKPLYGKLAWMNGGLLYGELYFTAGPALSGYENAGTFIGANAGVGLRFYLSETWSWRVDARDYFFVPAKSGNETRNELFFSTGISLNVR